MKHRTYFQLKTNCKLIAKNPLYAHFYQKYIPAELLHIAFQFIYEWFLLILKACMFAGEQLIIMEMKPHTLSSGQTLA